MLQPVDTVQALWEEYTIGLQGSPAVRELEKKSKTWRKYEGGRQAYQWHSYIYEQIERLIANGQAEAEAVSAVQADLDRLTAEAQKKEKPEPSSKRGRPLGPQWKALVKELQHAHPHRAPADDDDDDE